MEQSTAAGFDSLVAFRNSQGAEGRGTLIHVNRRVVVFEIYNPYSIVQLSEVLQDLRIQRGERVIYNGRGVVSNLVTTGLMLIVSATLVDPWSDLTGLMPGQGLRQEVERFVSDWDSSHRLSPHFQLSVSNIASFLGEVSRWLEHAELAVAEESPVRPPEAEREFFGEVEQPLTPRINELFADFEEQSKKIAPEESQAHKAFAHRELHPLLMCSPFIHRIYSKPLGYAGDYEMVNMILQDPVRGKSVYAKVVNAFFLGKDTAVAHRNRIAMLVERLTAEARRAERERRPLRILNIGCGPAHEVQLFLRTSPLADRCEFTLLDFNAETIAYATARNAEAAKDGHRKTKLQYVHKSIHELLKEASREALGKRDGGSQPEYDLVYCAGLFDYLSDKVCSRLLRLFYSWTAPGGLVVATNVTPVNPLLGFMNFVVEWHLIYRNGEDMAKLAPDIGQQTIVPDSTGVNVFIDIRKAPSVERA